MVLPAQESRSFKSKGGMMGYIGMDPGTDDWTAYWCPEHGAVAPDWFNQDEPYCPICGEEVGVKELDASNLPPSNDMRRDG